MLFCGVAQVHVEIIKKLEGPLQVVYGIKDRQTGFIVGIDDITRRRLQPKAKRPCR
jgi:hypothetical protein